MICDQCKTVAHCLKNRCVSKPDIIAMAREAGFTPLRQEPLFVEMLERFASIVAAAECGRIADEAEYIIKRAEARGASVEREACAKVCDGMVDAEYKTGKVDHNEMGWTQACSIAIRARGKIK